MRTSLLVTKSNEEGKRKPHLESPLLLVRNQRRGETKKEEAVCFKREKKKERRRRREMKKDHRVLSSPVCCSQAQNYNMRMTRLYGWPFIRVIVIQCCSCFCSSHESNPLPSAVFLIIVPVP